jgi:phosphoglycerate dehydrogenase-like enzyme
MPSARHLAVRIRFLGSTFPAARKILADMLVEDDVDAWPAGVPADPDGKADVLVRAMRRVDGQVMDMAQPVLIQQFGAGLEGVDLKAAAVRKIPIANPAAAADGPVTSRR